MDSDAAQHPLMGILGKVPSGIYILAAKSGDDETGMLASWVMQAGFEPPMLTVAVKQGRYLADWLTAGNPFALNVVAEEGKHLLSHFGRGFELGQPAFEGIATERHAAGPLFLTEGVVGYLICEPKAHTESGDHRIFVAEVIDGQSMSEARPMTHIRKTGSGY